MSLETRDYVATLTDVVAITKAVMSAQDEGSAGRDSYFKVLGATTQHEVGSPPRQRTTIVNKIDPATREKHLEALEAVNQRFYAVVVKTASEGLASHPRKVQLLQRRTNFARSAMTTWRQWIRAGNDITCLAMARVTKYSIQKDLEKRRRAKAPSVKVLTNQTARWTERLTKTATAMADADREAARQALQAAVERLQSIMARIGTSGVRPHKGRGGDGTTRRVHAAV